MRSIVAALCVQLAVTVPAGAAVFNGEQLQIAGGTHPAKSFSFAPSDTFAVGSAGPEVSAVYSASIFFDFDFSDTGLLTVGFHNPHPGLSFSAGFTPFTFTDVNGSIPKFTQFALLSSSFGFMQGDLSFSDDELSFDFGGRVLGNGQVLTAQIGVEPQVGVVPVPATLPLLVSALGLISICRRRRAGARAATPSGCHA
jgi:hypothetical protein